MYLKFETKKNEKSVMRKRNAQLLTTIGHLTHAIGEQSKNSNSDFSYSTYIETYRNR